MNTDIINNLIEDFTKDTEIFPVEIKMTSSKVLISIDKPSGITIEECASLSRFLYTNLEGSGLFERCELEVGSPGMDQPLHVYKQYLKRIGRPVRVITNKGTVHHGTIKHATEKDFELSEIIIDKEGKKKVKREMKTLFSFDEVKETRLELNFNK